MSWWRLVNAPAPWGDYGRVLVSGLTGRREAGEPLPVERVGPFVPPATIAGISDLVVTESFATELSGSGLSGFELRPARVERVVRLDWRGWDLTAPEPARYPAGNEPENYVLRRKHDAATADEVGDLYEVNILRTVDDPGQADLVRTALTPFSRIHVSDEARAFLNDRVNDWLSTVPA